ncbi:MAG: hypothetical protein ACREOU_14135 [Candidatus Eiseniibacteriota bacterium]
MAEDARPKSGSRTWLLAFAIIVLVFMVGGLVPYFTIFRPEIVRLTAARDQALRSTRALVVRLLAAEARHAIARGDVAGAERAVSDLEGRLAELEKNVPHSEPGERTALREILDRAKLVRGELARDPQAALRDLEIVESRLDALYPASSAAPASAPGARSNP